MPRPVGNDDSLRLLVWESGVIRGPFGRALDILRPSLWGSRVILGPVLCGNRVILGPVFWGSGFILGPLGDDNSLGQGGTPPDWVTETLPSDHAAALPVVSDLPSIATLPFPLVLVVVNLDLFLLVLSVSPSGPVAELL